MEEIPTRAFLVILTDPDEWELPKEYKDVVQNHLYSIPTSLNLPWPVHMCPRNIGDEISFSNMMTPYAEFVVEKFEYIYNRSRGATLDITLKQVDTEGDFTLRTLLYAADEGFTFESGALITDVLRDAGLKYTAAE